MNKLTTTDIYEYINDLMHMWNWTTYSFYDVEEFEMEKITHDNAILHVIDYLYQKHGMVTGNELEELTDIDLIEILIEKEIRVLSN